MSGRTPDRSNHISVLATKNLKLVAFMFKTMEDCSKDYRIEDINSTSVVHFQHQWELEQKKSDNIKAPKVNKNYWVMTVENIVMYLKLMRGMRGATGLCSLAPYQGGPHPLWIWHLPEP